MTAITTLSSDQQSIHIKEREMSGWKEGARAWVRKGNRKCQIDKDV